MQKTKAPVITLSSTDVLLDEAITIRVENLTPGETVRIKARTRDDDGTIWQSDITRTVGKESTLLLKGVDPEGLFTAMVPLNAKADDYIPLFEKNTLEPLRVTITCVTKSGTGEVAMKRRFLPAKGIVRLPVNDGALIGTLFYPERRGPHPVIIFLSGSGGKFNEPRAALLASHGFAVFSVAYFGIYPLPKELVEVPLEFFDRAVAFLKKQPMIDTARMGIFGFSKGGELALLLASRHPGIKAVAAYSPSSHVWQGLSKRGEKKSSWSYQGKPLPFVPMDMPLLTIVKFMTGRTVAMRSVYEGGFRRHAINAETARIPVEAIKAPIIITSGGKDAIWPADVFVKEIEKSRQRSGGTCISIDDAAGGHLAMQAFLPAAQIMGHLLFGGDARVTAALLAKAWTETIQLYKKHL